MKHKGKKTVGENLRKVIQIENALSLRNWTFYSVFYHNVHGSNNHGNNWDKSDNNDNKLQCLGVLNGLETERCSWEEEESQP